MSTWRRLALEHFPELRGEIERETNLTMLWLMLRSRFLDAYTCTPIDRRFIGRVYHFADSLLTTGNDNATDTIVSFYERLADPAYPQVREDTVTYLDLVFVACPAMRHHMTYDLDHDGSKYDEYLEWFVRTKRRVGVNEARAVVAQSRRAYEAVHAKAEAPRQRR